MTRSLYILGTVKIIAITIFLSSCSSVENKFSDSEGNAFETNTVYDNIHSKEDNELSFSIYFPESYNGNQKLPVVFMLDPHGQGSLPVEKYAQVANNQNFILVGSNVHRNGLASGEAEKRIKQIVDETTSRFEIDKDRMFIGGFSGGAKLAILYADRMLEFKGALACGGSMPISFDKEPHYYFVGIIGNKDFNYLEMRQSYSLFDQYGFDYTAMVFDGDHEWPPAETFEFGLIGFNIYSSKIGKTKLNEKWVDNVKIRLNDSVQHYQNNIMAVEEYEILQQMNRWLYGVEPVADIQKRIALIRQTKEFNNAVRNKQTLVQQEVKLRSEFIRAIDTRDFNWWRTEIDKFNKSDKRNYEAYMVKQRLLNYISMASFMLIKNELTDQDLDGAIDKIKIYELVDSDNPDVYLMYAKYYMLSGDNDKKLVNIEKARQLGLKNIDTYKNDVFWKGLFD